MNVMNMDINVNIDNEYKRRIMKRWTMKGWCEHGGKQLV